MILLYGYQSQEPFITASRLQSSIQAGASSGITRFRSRGRRTSRRSWNTRHVQYVSHVPPYTEYTITAHSAAASGVTSLSRDPANSWRPHSAQERRVSSHRAHHSPTSTHTDTHTQTHISPQCRSTRVSTPVLPNVIVPGDMCLPRPNSPCDAHLPPACLRHQ